MEGLYLNSQGLPSGQIQQLCAISKATYYRYLATYRTGGLVQLKAITVTPRESALHGLRGTLEAYFLAHPPATVAEAQAKIAELTGLERGPTQVRQFLHALGLKPRKVGTIPATADVEAQAEFKKKVWSHASPPLKPASALSSLWTRRILSPGPFSGCSGASSDSLSKRQRAVNA
jgi:transposase